MSIQAVAWALEQQIPAGPKLVLVALANHADHSSGLCWPSVTLIAHEASCSPRAVYRFVADLTRNGFVSVEKKRGKDGKQRSNNYWILFDRLPLDWSAVPPSHAQDAEESNTADQDVAGSTVQEDEPSDSQSPGEIRPAEVPEMSMTPGVKDEPGDSESPGPSDSGVTRKSLPEPSSVEPSRRAALRAGGVPHGYDPRARPTARVSAAAEEARRRSQPVFVIEGTRAYEAWAKVKAIENGVSRWHLTTTQIVDGKSLRGWHFPTLFPPASMGDTLSDEDSKALINMR